MAKRVAEQVQAENRTKPSPSTLLTFLKAFKSEAPENEATCAMIENKLTKSTGFLHSFFSSVIDTAIF